MAETAQTPLFKPRGRGRPTDREARERRIKLEQSDFLAGCTLEERASAVRLVRILRSNYWFSNFMEQMLALDAQNPFQMTLAKVRKQLDEMEKVEGLIRSAQHVLGSSNLFENHPVMRAIKQEWKDIAEYKSESRISALLASAQKTEATK